MLLFLNNLHKMANFTKGLSLILKKSVLKLLSRTILSSPKPCILISLYIIGLSLISFLKVLIGAIAKSTIAVAARKSITCAGFC